MIIRIWHGSTTHENAGKYEQLLQEVVFPRIAQKQVPGYRGIQLLKSIKEKGAHFITIMGFDDWEAVKNFAGADYEQSYVIDEAKALLEEYDHKAQHFELLHHSLSFSF